MLIVLGQITFFFFLYWLFRDTYGNQETETILHEIIWVSLLSANMLFFLLSTLLFLCVHCRDPGYSTSISKEKFYVLLDKAIAEGRSLDYFCFFCRTIYSLTGTHCMTCGKCVEGFDHHCSFVNNCIGYKNHAIFLNFLGTAVLYIMFSIANACFVIYRNFSVCNDPLLYHPDTSFCDSDGDAGIVIVASCSFFILLNLL